MVVYEKFGWICYKDAQTYTYDAEKAGKWMYFYDDKDECFVAKICEVAIRNKIVSSAKHRKKQNGVARSNHRNKQGGAVARFNHRKKQDSVACFYLNYDDIESHRKVISFFIENNLIPRGKTGRFDDISFKLDNRTRAGEYGKDFTPVLTLSRFIDLDSGEWLL